MNATDEMRDALTRAGVAVRRRFRDDQFIIERADVDQELVIRCGPWTPVSGLRCPFAWDVWTGSHAEDKTRWRKVDNGWAADVGSMVARVAEFLGEKGR